jgi:hypothetical protein
MITQRLRIEEQNSSIPRPYLEFQIEPGETIVVAKSNNADDVFLKFDENEFIDFCEKYLEIVKKNNWK